MQHTILGHRGATVVAAAFFTCATLPPEGEGATPLKSLSYLRSSWLACLLGRNWVDERVSTDNVTGCWSQGVCVSWKGNINIIAFVSHPFSKEFIAVYTIPPSFLALQQG